MRFLALNLLELNVALFEAMTTRNFPLTFASPDSATGRTPVLPPEFSLLVLDSLSSPGLFALVHFIVKALKPRPEDGSSIKRPVILVGINEGKAGWDSLLRKQGVQVSSEPTKDSFVFITPEPEPCTSLSSLASQIEEAISRLTSLHAPSLVVIDDLSSFLWAGQRLEEVQAFRTRLLADIQRRTHASLLILAHADLTSISRSSPHSDAADEALVRTLIRSSDVTIRLRELGPDSGEMTISRGPAYLADRELPLTESAAFATQYRLKSDNSVAYVTKGLDEGFI